jgi:hypothetical protein
VIWLFASQHGRISATPRILESHARQIGKHGRRQPAWFRACGRLSRQSPAAKEAIRFLMISRPIKFGKGRVIFSGKWRYSTYS